MLLKKLRYTFIVKHIFSIVFDIFKQLSNSQRVIIAGRFFCFASYLFNVKKSIL